MKEELPDHIEQWFADVLSHRITIDAFEKWVYDTPSLEALIGAERYMDLISMDYKVWDHYGRLRAIITPLVNEARHETKRIKEELTSIITRDERCADALNAIHFLHSEGHYFLERLSMRFGVWIDHPPLIRGWYLLNEQEKEERINGLYPEAGIEAERVLSWMESGKIIIKNNRHRVGWYEYDDLRSEEEKAQSKL